jgi:hypothetical protein
VAIGFYRFFSEELGRLGYVEGENLMVERCSGEGWTERYADLARDVVSTHPDLTSAPRDVPVMHSTIPVYDDCVY